MTKDDADIKKIGGEINSLSTMVLYIEMYFDNTKLSSGTAFFINSEKGPVFITNRHNVTGRHQETNEILNIDSEIPNNIRFEIIGSHEPVWYAFDLYTDTSMTNPVWLEHPTLGSSVDVVAILISEIKNAIHLFVDIKENWHKWRIADRVHVLGFPFGMNDNFAIWSTGYIASEPDTNFNKLPRFLIDCRARPGQSGALVIARILVGDIVEYEGKQYQAKKDMVHFLGIYSGRINVQSDLGIVWKMEVLRDLVRTIESKEHIEDVKCAYNRLRNEP